MKTPEIYTSCSHCPRNGQCCVCLGLSERLRQKFCPYLDNHKEDPTPARVPAAPEKVHQWLKTFINDHKN